LNRQQYAEIIGLFRFLPTTGLCNPFIIVRRSVAMLKR